MAAGIDAAGQNGALENGGESYAVLGCGVDICYPPSNIRLFELLADQGGLISEYPPGTGPLRFHFPQRNRLISGLSDVVLILEAGERSGSLITADQALEQGRDVMALPGRLGDPLSIGCNSLIRQGAAIISAPADILMLLEEKYPGLTGRQGSTGASRPADGEPAGQYAEATPEEKQILTLLSLSPTHIQVLAAGTGWNFGRLFSVLLHLELKGWIRQTENQQYILDGSRLTVPAP